MRCAKIGGFGETRAFSRAHDFHVAPIRLQRAQSGAQSGGIVDIHEHDIVDPRLGEGAADAEIERGPDILRNDDSRNARLQRRA